MRHIHHSSLISSLMLSLLLVACGGGGSSGSSSTSSSASSTTISGTAASGTPYAGADVVIVDSTGANVGTTTTAADGSFALKFDPTAFIGPFIATVTGNIGAGTESLVSIQTGTAVANGNLITNITPITHAIASRVSSTGNPLDLVDKITSEKSNITAAKVGDTESSFRALLDGHLSSVGLNSNFNLISSPYTSGFDKLLDNVKVDTAPGGQVSMSSAAGLAVDDYADVSTSPSTGSTLVLAKGTNPKTSDKSSIPTLPAGSSVVGIDALESLRVSLNTCFTQTVAQRTSSPECNNVISSAYKNDGRSKSSEFGPGQAFNLTDTGNTNMTFLKPEILRQLATVKDHERLVVRITGVRRSDLTDGTAGTTRELVTIVENNADSKSGWVLVGNGRDFNTFVNGAASKRIAANNLSTSRLETGLNMYIQSDPAILKTVVTGPGLPSGGITLLNRSGCDFLTISADGSTMPSNCAGYYRLNSVLASDGKTPFTATSNTYLFASPYLSDADILAIQPNSFYKFVITKTSGAGGGTVTYWNRLRSRPLTGSELTQVKYVDFTPATYAEMTNATIYTGGAQPTVAWTTPANTPRPFKVYFFHNAGTDDRNVPFNVASTSVPCAGNSECSGSNYTTLNPSSSSQYMFQLVSRNRFDLQIFTQLSK